VRSLIAAGLVVVACGAIAAATPAETRARAAAIRTTAAAIAQECQRYGNGDWAAWYKRSQPFRNNMRPLVDAAMNRVAPFRADPVNVKSPLLRAGTTPPIYELPSYAYYLLPPNEDDLTKWVGDLPSGKTIVEVSRWLKAKNIDLVVAPTPRMAEVYGDLLAEGAPPEKIIAPHYRRFLLNLLEADVEVVDLLPVFLKSRADNLEPLYLPADGHWSDHAQRLAAAEIGRRLKRYEFVKTALARKRLFTSTPARANVPGSIYDLLTPPQREEVKDAVAAMPITHVKTIAGKPFEEPAASPVLVIGDSFTHFFQMGIMKGSGVDALLAQEINVPVSNISMGGATLQPIKELLRNPSMLEGRRVVVWVFNNSLLTYGGDSWTLPPLPR
jgi:hypothetical protein